MPSAQVEAVSPQTLKVHAMESGAGESWVGVALVSKAPLAVSMMPLKLTRSQARELIFLSVPYRDISG